jgi:hypothetical protein
MKGLSGLLFLLGIGMFLNAAGGNWAFGQAYHGATAVALDIVIGLMFWVPSYLLWRFAEFRDRQREGREVLRAAREEMDVLASEGFRAEFLNRYGTTAERYFALYEELSLDPPKPVHQPYYSMRLIQTSGALLKMTCA